METITIILGLVMLVFGILQIILFFKVWGMTNDVRKITHHLIPIKHHVPQNTRTHIKIGDTVIIKSSGHKMTVIDIRKDGALCATDTGAIEGTFQLNEIMLYDE